MRPPAETQPERTALAWQRTGLGVMAVAGLLGHRAVRGQHALLLVLAGLAALLGLAVLGALAPVRYRDVRRRVTGLEGGTSPRPAAVIVAGIVGIVAAVAAIGVLTPR